MGSRKSNVQGLVNAIFSLALKLRFISSSAFDLYILPVMFVRVAARRCSKTGEYVSGTMSETTIQSMPLNMVLMQDVSRLLSLRRPLAEPHKNPSSHRNPKFWAIKPPTTGPSTGPSKGAEEKTMMPRPRCEAGNISATTPPALANNDEPNAPFINRITTRPAILGTMIQSPLNMVNMPSYTGVVNLSVVALQSYFDTHCQEKEKLTTIHLAQRGPTEHQIKLLESFNTIDTPEKWP
jgi:hypothetical protein